MQSVDAALALVDAVCHPADASEPSPSAFCICRPPGHHVTVNRPMGFGIYNIVSVAARYAQAQHNLKKVLVVDFDVHHGNGTHDTFYDDSSVMYISTHQSGLWPYTGMGFA